VYKGSKFKPVEFGFKFVCIINLLIDTEKVIDMNSNLVNYARILVFFFVCSSKQIFIYNEETLVALCFVGFMVFSFSYFGASIQEFFDQRKEMIQTELQEFSSLKENCLNNLLIDYQKSSKTVAVLQDINQFCTDQIVTLCSSKEKNLQLDCSYQVQQKLRGLSHSQKLLEENLQSAISLGFRESVLEEFHRSQKELKSRLINQALQVFKSDSK
jgi:hypothetical protein